MAETLIPGDTVVCADDAACYPPVAGDDPAALAASTAAALAPAVGDALGVGDGLAGAAIGAASAVAGTVIAEATEGGKSAPVLRFLKNEEAKVTIYDKVRRFLLRNTVRSSAAAFRDFDPDRPAVRLQSKAVSSAPFPPSPFEEAAMAIAAAENVAGTVEALVPLPSAVEGVIDAVEDVADKVDEIANEVGAAFGQRVPFEVYEHHNPFLFPKWAFANDEAPKILRQKRRRASIATGESGCSDFSPGHRFELREHAIGQLDGAYVVTSVEHRGETHPGEGGGAWRVYENAFECAPSGMAYVPPRPKRKSVQVTLTATVVGPPGEEIHVDDKGQIKVQFHWDRDGKLDGNSSCWIRVMQPWSGAAWGHQFIPRVGMEVVVTFEGGDPDKPMVLGSVYNGTHPMPFKLPEQKMKSGIRTSTYPGGQGFNELSFNDARGAEQILIKAQLDMDEVVERHHKVHIGAHQTQTIRGKQVESVEQDQILTVALDRTVGVGRDLKSTVGNDRVSSVGRDDAVVVGGDAKALVSGHYAVEVKHGYSVTVGSGQAPAQSDHYVNGSGSLGASERLVIRAEKGLVLQCGDTIVELTPEGLELFGKSIKASGADISISGDGPSVELGQNVQVFSKSIAMHAEKSTLTLGDTAELKGDKIQLKSNQAPPAPAGSKESPDTQQFSCQFSDYYLRPYANKTFHLRAEGLKVEGTTDGEGTVKAKIPKDAQQVVVTIWIDEYPTGRRKTYTLSQATISPASTVEGALIRLKNLGYFRGDPSDGITDAARVAIQCFQEDHKESHALEPTGELDGPTQGALVDVYGS
jgi:type VI secretion system secreted protein VgrG